MGEGVRFAAILIVLSLLMFSCKKYGEDERRGLQTPCKRLDGKWQLYSILNGNGEELINDTLYFDSKGGDYWFPNEAIFEFNGPGKYFCYDVGSRGEVSSPNRVVSSGYYVFRMKKTYIKLDVRMIETSPNRYFIGDYHIENSPAMK